VAGGNVRSPRSTPPAATAAAEEIGWKWERVSASERHGTVKSPSAALLTRRRLRPAGGGALRQGCPRGPTTPPVFRVGRRLLRPWSPRNWDMRPAARPPGRDANRPDRQGRTYRRPTGPQRIVDQAKARGNARDTGEVPGCLPTELNSTIAEGVKVFAASDGDSRKAC
jgi:hypothetical protein